MDCHCKNYQGVTKISRLNSSMNNTSESNNTEICYCVNSKSMNNQQNENAELKNLNNQLKIENQSLRRDLQEQKLNIQHYIDRLHASFQNKLQTEQQRLIQIQSKLYQVSKTLSLSQEAFQRERTDLKLQLSTAYSNIKELKTINIQLNNEFAELENTCLKIEQNLIKQKISEADTLKRLTKKTSTKCVCDSSTSAEEAECKDNLQDVARKLSLTLRETNPCDNSFSKEFISAAKSIKDLTELVLSRSYGTEGRSSKVERKEASTCSEGVGNDLNMGIPGAFDCTTNPKSARKSDDDKEQTTKYGNWIGRIISNVIMDKIDETEGKQNQEN